MMVIFHHKQIFSEIFFSSKILHKLNTGLYTHIPHDSPFSPQAIFGQRFPPSKILNK